MIRFFIRYEYSDLVSTHSHPKVAAMTASNIHKHGAVSTHSHPKVAADPETKKIERVFGFNTQPPEGGCSLHKKMIKISKLFTVFRYPLKHKEWEGV